MAAALLNKRCGEFFEAHSAGLEPGTLNPLAVEALREMDIDISKNNTQAVFDVFNRANCSLTSLRFATNPKPKAARFFPA